MKSLFLCHFFKKSSAKIGLSRNAHPSMHFCIRDGFQGTLKAHYLSNKMRFERVEALYLSLVSLHRSALIEWQRVVKHALKAVTEAVVPGVTCDLRNDDFLWLRFLLKRKEGTAYFFATFLEKVAQKAAFRESLALPGTTAIRAAFKERSRPTLDLLNALRPVEALCFLTSFGPAKRINQ